MIKNIFNYFRKNDIGEPPWEYDFLVNLPESEYPKYLAKVFNYRTGEKLPLKFDFKQQAWVIDKNKCKTFNQKIQWLKLYGVTDLMRKCTDKVKVRDYVRERIGEKYLKPVLQICNSFDEINFDKLPNTFVIKTNHGCKWQYIIKDKEKFLDTPQLFEIVKRNITGWLEQDYSFLGGFEMQYRSIESKILIEALMRDNINKNVEEIHCYCFKGIPKLTIRIDAGTNNYTSLYDENIKIINDILLKDDIKSNKPVDNLLNHSISLSKQFSIDFKFVRIDWMVYQNKLYFAEMTFTPYSGFNKFTSKKLNKKFENCLKIGEQYEL